MTNDDWIDQIKWEPGIAVHCLAYADWLDERGEPPSLAFALRWMARHGRRPGHRGHYGRTRTNSVRSVPGKLSWCWLAAGHVRHEKVKVPDTCQLPRWLFVAVAGKALPGHVYYPSWNHAVLGLADALDMVRKTMET